MSMTRALAVVPVVADLVDVLVLRGQVASDDSRQLAQVEALPIPELPFSLRVGV